MINKKVEILQNAIDIIETIDKLAQQIDDAGGLTTISGVAKASAFFSSLKKNRSRVRKLIILPMNDFISDLKDQQNETKVVGAEIPLQEPFTRA